MSAITPAPKPQKPSYDDLDDAGKFMYWALRVVAVATVIVALTMWGCPQYEVYRQNLHGQAELSKAHQTRQITIEQAKAEEASAQHRANAIKIMGEAAKQYPEYRQQEFIGAFAEAMHNGRISQIIYVPTEANIPITEATRHKPVANQEKQ